MEKELKKGWSKKVWEADEGPEEGRMRDLGSSKGKVRLGEVRISEDFYQFAFKTVCILCRYFILLM